AIGRAVAPAAAIDQRGVIREFDPDSGAIEALQTGRIVINEIHFDPDSPARFVELHVPRDSTQLDLSPYSLWVNGTNVFNFSDASDPMVRPGRGIIVADDTVAVPPPPAPTTPVEVVTGGLGL